MALFRKSHLALYLEQLDKYYTELRAAIEGSPANPNVSHDYNCEPDQFQHEFSDIDLDRLDFAIGHFKVAVAGLKTLAKKKAPRNHKH